MELWQVPAQVFFLGPGASKVATARCATVGKVQDAGSTEVEGG